MKTRTKHYIFTLTMGFILAILGTAFIKDPSLPTSGDYINDTTQLHIVNDMQESLQPINMLLCVLAKTNFAAHTNKGTYLALVSQSSCEQASSDKKISRAITSANSIHTEYMKLIVNATRSAGGPEAFKVWLLIPQQKNSKYSTPIMLKIKGMITETPTATNPYGLFVLNYAGYPINTDMKPSLTPIIRGYLNNIRNIDNHPQMAYAEQDTKNGNNIIRKVLLIKLTNGGYGKSETRVNGSEEKYAIAYNDDLLMLNTDSEQTSLCYNRNDFAATVYQYGLYDTKGARVNPKAELPLVYMNNKIQHFLQYVSNGNIQGITGNCVNSKGSTVKCEAPHSFWKANDNIPEGTRLVSPTKHNSYWIKALNIGQLLSTLPTDICEAALPSLLSSARTAQLPTISGWTNPNLGNPPIIKEPAVIDGVDHI